MKIINLLNKIANGEKVPENIVFRGEQYGFYKDNYTYCDENMCDRWLFDDLYRITDILNDKIELIEENKEIEEYKTKYTERCIDVEVRNKLNELVRAVNKLNKESEVK